LKEISPISIAVSTKDRRDDLSRLLISINKLNYPEHKIEIVVVEEGDNSRPIDGIKYVFIPRLDKGFGYTRNIAVSHCSHELIAFVDDDCEVTPDWLNELLTSMDADTVGVTGGVMVKNCSIIGYCENLLGLPSGGISRIHSANKIPHKTNELITCNAMIRKSAILDAGGFNEKETVRFGGEDSLLSHNLIQKGYKLQYNPNAIVYHKTKDNIKAILKWAIRMGRSRYIYNKIISKRNNIIHMLRTSIFVKLILFIAGLFLFYQHAALYIFFVLALYWVITVKKNIFCKNYFKNYIAVLLMLPLVKFTIDIGIGYGQLAASIGSLKK
jgi:GT2 family glycosyltransferase